MVGFAPGPTERNIGQFEWAVRAQIVDACQWAVVIVCACDWEEKLLHRRGVLEDKDLLVIDGYEAALP